MRKQSLEMTEGEIRREYGSAKNKKQQIKILAQLNACDEKVIEEIVGISVNEQSPIMSKLYAEIARVDGEIKALEDRYKKFTIALEVIAELEGADKNGKR